MLHLLTSWNAGGAFRRPWALLDAIGAPVDDPVFMVWSRSQILRLGAALFRRYEQRFSTWPYLLFILQVRGAPEAARRAVAERLLAAARHHLDVYSLGIRFRFPTLDALMSSACRSVLVADFRTHAYGTDAIEREGTRS